MSKNIVRVRIHRGDQTKGENMMVYPSRYNAQEVDSFGMGPLNVMGGSAAYSGAIGRGEDEEWCLVVLRSDKAQEYAEDPEMEIISAEAADDLMEQWRIDNDEPEEIITDPDRVGAIRAKQMAGIALSSEDRRALDPKDNMRGINKRLRPMRLKHKGLRDTLPKDTLPVT